MPWVARTSGVRTKRGRLAAKADWLHAFVVRLGRNSPRTEGPFPSVARVRLWPSRHGRGLGGHPDPLPALQISAAQFQDATERIDLPLDRGADLNPRDKHGMNLLLRTASINFDGSEMTDLLIPSGTDPTATNRDGLTPTVLARTRA